MMLHRKSSLPIWETEPEQGLTRENYHEKEADDAAKERHLMAKTQEQLEKEYGFILLCFAISNCA